MPLDGQGVFDSATVQGGEVGDLLDELAEDVQCVEVKAESTDDSPVSLSVDTVSFCKEFCEFRFVDTVNKTLTWKKGFPKVDQD